jgi:ABC-type antimicrobial peptide transport system permease subunit
MWWKFRKHKMALISAVILIIMYLAALFCEFVAPYGPDDTFVRDKRPRQRSSACWMLRASCMLLLSKDQRTVDLETLRTSKEDLRMFLSGHLINCGA